MQKYYDVPSAKCNGVTETTAKPPGKSRVLCILEITKQHMWWAKIHAYKQKKY